MQVRSLQQIELSKRARWLSFLISHRTMSILPDAMVELAEREYPIIYNRYLKFYKALNSYGSN